MMNKRIQKLFNEAGFHQPEMERLGIEDKFEKFALLIVRECANLPFKSTGEVTTIGEIAVSNMILKHFGVEE